MEQLEADIASMTEEKASLEESMNSGTLAYNALQTASTRFAELSTLLSQAEDRWLELSMIEEDN